MLVSPPQSSNHISRTNVTSTTSTIPLKAQNDHSSPLAGVVVCCTSLPDEKRTSLAAQAQQMGAIHRYDLTLDVTHLIIGKHDTEKYRYVAKERPDVRPMTVAWIESVRDLWVNDKEINMDELERAHTMPILHSLKISMTGCDDPTERANIAAQVQSNGAVYEGDLTKQITHLISFRTEGAKYRAARSWGLKIVSIEWLRDTLERGMILNEALYDPTIPIQERGKGAWDRTKPGRTLLGKRQRDESIAEGGKKKLRRTASMKLNSQSDQMWGDIVGGVNVAQVNRSGQWENSREVESVAEHRETPKLEVRTENRSAENDISRLRGMFAGHRYHYYGFSPEQAQIVRDHLISHGAQISDSIEDLVLPTQDFSGRLFIILPHDLAFSQHQNLIPPNTRIEAVTVWWLERCLHNKGFLEPRDHAIGQPFKTFPIEGFQSLSISTTGFNGIDLLHVTKSIRLVGATYDEDLTPQTSAIVVRAFNQIRADKFAFAQQWKIPIVNIQWLWDSIQAGTRMSFQNYRARERKVRPPLEEIQPPRPEELQTRRSLSNDVRSPLIETSAISRQAVRLSSSTCTDALKCSEIKFNQEPGLATLKTTTESTAQELSADMQACTEISNSTSSSKTVSTAPAPSDHPRTREEYNSEIISDLLAKTKTSIPPKETPGAGRRGGPKRILGRVTSNMSAGSVSNSRAASIDSTAHGGLSGVVDEDSNSRAANQTANERIQVLMKRTMDHEESQPPATQLGYADPESELAEEIARAKMMGDKIPVKRAGMKEKTLTINDIGNLAEKPRARRTRATGK